MTMTPIFNVVAAYTDQDGGVYEWEGKAADYDDAIANAQRQAWEDNCPTAVSEGEEQTDMLDAEKGFSVMDVTVVRALEAELVALKDAAVQVAYEAIEAVTGELDGQDDTGGTLGLLLDQARAVVERDKAYDIAKSTSTIPATWAQAA
jgi:NADH dehydrogenase/NADH:ubiquinone oxidoreductase subunit G